MEQSIQQINPMPKVNGGGQTGSKNHWIGHSEIMCYLLCDCRSFLLPQHTVRQD